MNPDSYIQYCGQTKWRKIFISTKYFTVLVRTGPDSGLDRWTGPISVQWGPVHGPGLTRKMLAVRVTVLAKWCGPVLDRTTATIV